MPRRREKETLIQGGYLPPEQRSRSSSMDTLSTGGGQSLASSSQSSLLMPRPEMLNSAADLKTLLYAGSDRSKRIAGGRGYHVGDVFRFDVDVSEMAYGMPEWLQNAPFPQVEQRPRERPASRDVATMSVPSIYETLGAATVVSGLSARDERLTRVPQARGIGQSKSAKKRKNAAGRSSSNRMGGQVPSDDGSIEDAIFRVPPPAVLDLEQQKEGGGSRGGGEVEAEESGKPRSPNIPALNLPEKGAAPSTSEGSENERAKGAEAATTVAEVVGARHGRGGGSGTEEGTTPRLPKGLVLPSIVVENIADRAFSKVPSKKQAARVADSFARAVLATPEVFLIEQEGLRREQGARPANLEQERGAAEGHRRRGARARQLTERCRPALGLR